MARSDAFQPTGAETKRDERRIAAEGSTEVPAVTAALGETLRTLRNQRKLSTRALASLIGVSSGFISQLENGIAMPSLATLVKLAGALNVQIADLFEATPPATQIIRRDERPRVEYPDIGVVDEILSADPRKQLEVLLGYITPGGGSGDELYTHGAATEFVLVVSGELSVILGDDVHKVSAGDSITFSGDLPHGYINEGDVTAEVVWVMTPATY